MNRDNKHNPLYISMLFRFFINSFEFVGCIRFGLMDGWKSIDVVSRPNHFCRFLLFFWWERKSEYSTKTITVVYKRCVHLYIGGSR